MATIKISQLSEYLQGKNKQAQKKTLAKWKKAATPVVKREIQSRIGKGQSPVEGVDNFEPYSDSYKKAISSSIGKKYGKNLKPVNIKLSGRLRASLKVRAITAGLSVWFSDEKAKWIGGKKKDRHKNMPRRPLLPVLTREKFKKKINDKLTSLYIKLFNI